MQLTNLVIGQYYPGDSVLHRADPRTKIIAAFLYVVVLFMVSGLPALVLLGAGAAAGIVVARIPMLWLYRGIRPVLFLVLITFLFQLFLYGGDVLWRLGPVTFYREGVLRGGFLALRFLLLLISSSLLTFTTPPVRLTDGLGRLMAPLARLRFPAYELALMMTIALRFIPTLLAELDRIIKAQMARGADVTHGGLITRARNTLPIMIPLFVMSFRHADQLALAMEARCYRGGKGRTLRHKLHFGRLDVALALIIIALLGAALWLGRFR
ncbi:energy-coupling factor transporter transmembrane protein EcfT [bacterium BMS3Abin01]|nr:energy-coupling factor transporter transmembrane protein EcfT [bacterium BMS3Abin01]HDZ59361.1 energy-coupling factor transporter transmembrane protein EcfT [Actinomycetota bacterium]